ncbi:FAD-dependent oxidoreductase [Candidatus Lokiarchaeum ossiferum]|uniref:FAD-dependent oxidoreductase n=1 Tax=Candidatus Lokiarchaeum ossiferum TaxID=2951803 RepID=UPI00352BEE99
MNSQMKNFAWSTMDRNKLTQNLEEKHFDLIIIGGGMTGAGICREAALRGLSFLLLDKNDFAFGTSSRSSKLIHGGLRYLGNNQFKVVRESCTERNWLRNHFPNLVRPLAFNLYSYEGYMYSPQKVKIALYLYNKFSDTFSKFKNYAKPKILTREEFLEMEPNIREEGFVMGGYYYDNNVDDARLTLETIKESLFFAKGKSIALNYAKVDGFETNETGKVIGVKIVDKISNQEYSAFGTQVVNATGIFTDEILQSQSKYIRPTKGVHLVIKNERLGNHQAFGLQSKEDGRFYFVLRREKYTIIGTTDTDYNGDLNNPICTKADADYLLDGVNFLFPNAHITEKDIISTYAGIRPLVVDPNAKDAGEVSRKHVIIDHTNGLVSLIGGKLTIYRLMGEDLLYHLVKKNIFPKFPRNHMKKKFSMQPFLVGLKKEEFDNIYSKGEKQGIYPKLDDELLEDLHRQYGNQAFEILEDIMKNPEKGNPLIEGNNFCAAEIEWICDHEFAPHLLDMVCRRTELSLFVHHTKSQEIASKVATIMGKKYGWDNARVKEEIQTYVDYVSNWLWF